MKRTLKFISFLLFLILPDNPLPAREPFTERETSSAQEVETDSVPESRIRGIRIGYDLAGLSLLYFDPGRMIHTFSVDFEAWQDIYPVVEFGFQDVLLEKDNYTYGSGGIFGRAGVDLNLLKYEKSNVYEMMYAGFRYGLAYLTHYAEDITVQDDYFGDLSGGNIEENQINAHWISVVGGVRVEVFNNFFMGWSVLANLKLAQVKDSNMVPYNIPGFGRGNKRTSIIINYTVAYRIPLQRYTPRKIIKKKEEQPAEEE